MGKSRFIELMAKSIDKSASQEELKELESFLEQFPRYRKMQQVTNAIKSEIKEPGDALTQADVDTKLDDLWTRIKQSENIEKKPREIISLNKYRLIWAAAVALLSVGGILFYKNRSQSNNALLSAVIRKVDVPYGKMIQLVLPDGTKVKLNAGSHFSYPENFLGAQRDVSLEGEGFFEVTKNPRKPFLVHTAGLTVRVLGTVFNVRAYKEDKRTETTLLKGKVEVTLKDDPEKKIILSPHEKLVVLNDRSPLNPQKQAAKDVAKVKYELATLPVVENDEYQENAWIENKIVFTNSDFEDVAVQMERKYNVHIIFEDEALKWEQISGVLKNEDLETALLILKQITAFKSKIENGNVYLSRLNKQ